MVSWDAIFAKTDASFTKNLIISESGFAYTMGLMGRTVALLVSEVINCQLGGASLQYWYYKTGPAASLEVCIRQPPGNLEPTGLR